MKQTNKKKIAFKKDRTYEWLIIAQSYLQCALICARTLEKELQAQKFGVSQKSPLDYCLKEIYGNYQQSPEYLVFPIIFNFKHGLEIYLKAISGIKKENFIKEHNLMNLVNDTMAEKNKVEKLISKYSYARLLLPNNGKQDTENIFERYPQGTPYDRLDVRSTATKEKIKELLADIETAYKLTRDTAIEILQTLKNT